jgi:cytochrome oxidase Cu insertion factor (SCO1/SenC/PrrC family)
MSKRAFLYALAAAMLSLGFMPGGDNFKRERGGENDAKKDALEGKAPPAFTVSEWLNTNGKALDWKSLKGKVVVLDFWAHW